VTRTSTILWCPRTWIVTIVIIRIYCKLNAPFFVSITINQNVCRFWSANVRRRWVNIIGTTPNGWVSDRASVAFGVCDQTFQKFVTRTSTILWCPRTWIVTIVIIRIYCKLNAPFFVSKTINQNACWFTRDAGPNEVAVVHAARVTAAIHFGLSFTKSHPIGRAVISRFFPSDFEGVIMPASARVTALSWASLSVHWTARDFRNRHCSTIKSRLIASYSNSVRATSSSWAAVDCLILVFHSKVRVPVTELMYSTRNHVWISIEIAWICGATLASSVETSSWSSVMSKVTRWAHQSFPIRWTPLDQITFGFSAPLHL